MNIAEARCDIEIFERVPDVEAARGYPLKPNGLLINGTEVLLPGDATIEISQISHKEFVKLTLTVYPTSLRIRPTEEHK